MEQAKLGYLFDLPSQSMSFGWSVAQLEKILPAIPEALDEFLGQDNVLEKG